MHTGENLPLTAGQTGPERGRHDFTPQTREYWRTLDHRRQLDSRPKTFTKLDASLSGAD